AAFGRLCVETWIELRRRNCKQPAAFGRLCVETTNGVGFASIEGPAAFGRLCVETYKNYLIQNAPTASRLRAAVC
ncbi:hypothetical protein, partial [Neisseria sp. HMSC064F03]|uniref:hypothetical protein n=1 Tax=Neisseria sp. HMSC064F03 TaxID=1715037 RepID=UPI00114CDA88